MHLLESYALVSGQKISSCFIHEEIIELPYQKYITLHSEHDKGTSRRYRRWKDVVDLLINNKNFDYEIVQIGQNRDPINEKVNERYVGRTNYHSLAFLIKNASLHLGYDSLPVHLASHFNKKIVALYPQYKGHTGPYFSEEKDIIILEPEYKINSHNGKKIKPSYSSNCSLMNTIEPELVYKSVLQLLNINE